MKNIWKWILGIIVTLLILGAPLLLHYTRRDNFIRGFERRAPMIERMERFAWDHHPGFGRGLDRHAPMDRRGGFGFFGPLRLLGGLAKLVLFGALLYGAYWLGRRNAHVVLEPVPSAPTSPGEPAPGPNPEQNGPKRE